jgi:hypothetical protein
MKKGLSPSTKWWIALVALVVLAMGIHSAASAGRVPVLDANPGALANALLLQDNVDTLLMLHETDTTAPAYVDLPTPETITFRPSTGVNCQLGLMLQQ